MIDDGYVDARELLDGFDRRMCPQCGTEEWLKHLEKKRWRTDQWNCQSCGSYYEDALEYACPKCDIRMAVDGDEFVCHNVECPVAGVEFDKEAVLGRLASDAYPKRAHKPGVLMGKCPLCGDSSGVNGGPDGELECDECNDFYAGQYSDAWYCYGIWMRDRDRIRVNAP